MNEVELFINAIIHYWSFGTILTEYEKDERFPLTDITKLKVISFGTRAELMEIFTNLVSSKTSLSEQDKEDITYFVKNIADYFEYLPDEIPLKENVGFICKTILDNAPIKGVRLIEKYFHTATDVLRFIVALSDGDISLATPTKFKKLNRRERRMVMDLLAECGNITEDLFRYQYEWIRVGEIVHPAEFKNERYDNVNKAFKTLRSGKKPLFFGGRVEKEIEAWNVDVFLHLLKTRTGDFARRLDYLLRYGNSVSQNKIIQAFADVADNVSTPVLLQVRQHFLDRTNQNKVRVFFPKGSVAKVWAMNNNLPEIPERVCQKVIKVCEDALTKNYSTRDTLGKVYIDKEFTKFFVPFSQRSASKATKTMVRGSRFTIDKSTKVIRGFTWWTNAENDRVDLDLSLAVYDDEWNLVRRITYYDLRNDDRLFKGCHSGDITNGGKIDGKGVAEFIDIDLSTVDTTKIRYAAFTVNSYTGQKFSDLPNATFGFMQRQSVQSGEVFEPKTVETNIDMNNPTTMCIPMVLDLKTREFIWCDLAVRGDTRINNLDMSLGQTTAACYAMANMSKPTMFDVAMLNAKARGQMTTDRNSADIIFSNDKTPPVEEKYIEREDGLFEKQKVEKKDIPIIGAYDVDYFMSLI